jgi:guanylate kinase
MLTNNQDFKQLGQEIDSAVFLSYSYSIMQSFTQHPIFAFVGPSGSGKSTLILEIARLFPHFQIVKSTTTRPTRLNEHEDLFYTPTLAINEFETKSKNGEFINFQNYAGNWYGTLNNPTLKLLETNCGLMAMVEEAIFVVRNFGIDVKAINILPENNFEIERTVIRKEADMKRSATPLDFELTITNSFKPGGLENSITKLSEYFNKVLASHVVDVVNKS